MMIERGQKFSGTSEKFFFIIIIISLTLCPSFSLFFLYLGAKKERERGEKVKESALSHERGNAAFIKRP